MLDHPSQQIGGTCSVSLHHKYLGPISKISAFAKVRRAKTVIEFGIRMEWHSYRNEGLKDDQVNPMGIVALDKVLNIFIHLTLLKLSDLLA